MVMDKMPHNDHGNPDKLRDPEDRPISNEQELREKMLDKTLADSFPTSDPPSTIPDPAGEDSLLLSESENEPPNKHGLEVADDNAGRGVQDRSRIILSDDGEVRYWTELLGVSREQLEHLVRRHGDSAKDIREKLKREAA